MLKVFYKTSFVREFNGFDAALQEEILEKIELFKHIQNHKQLKVHKLHGNLRKLNSFTVNYQIRIVFQFLQKNEVSLIHVGNHDVYK